MKKLVMIFLVFAGILIAASPTTVLLKSHSTTISAGSSEVITLTKVDVNDSTGFAIGSTHDSIAFTIKYALATLDGVTNVTVANYPTLRIDTLIGKYATITGKIPVLAGIGKVNLYIYVYNIKSSGQSPTFKIYRTSWR